MLQEQRRWKISVLLVLLAGFLAGSALPELFHMGSGDYAGLFSMYSLQKYEQTVISGWNIFSYVLASRLKMLLFLWMSTYTAAGPLFHFCYLGWLSVAAGMLLALFTLREGQEGILLFGCCLFPQWILYAAMWRQELQVMFARRRGRYFIRDAGGITAGWKGEARESEKWISVRKDLGELGKLCGLGTAGAATEAFLGTWTLKIFLQIFC